MMSSLTPQSLERWIDEQEALAVIATCDEVRMMHRELAALYRAQLSCVLAADLLMPSTSEQKLDLAA